MTIIAFGSIGSFSPHLYGDNHRAGVIPFIGTGNKGQQAVVCAGNKCRVVIQRLCKQFLLKGQEIPIVSEYGAVKGELGDIRFQHSHIFAMLLHLLMV